MFLRVYFQKVNNIFLSGASHGSPLFFFSAAQELQLMKILPYIFIGIACFALGWFVRPMNRQQGSKSDTIQVPPIVVTKTKVDTLLLVSPMPYIAWLTGDTVEVDGCRHAKEVKVYTDDSTYTAWVSGVRPSLDSIRTYRHTRYVDRYIYRDVVRREKPKRWGIGLSAGYGIGKDGLSPVLAVTVNWNLFQW